LSDNPVSMHNRLLIVFFMALPLVSSPYPLSAPMTPKWRLIQRQNLAKVQEIIAFLELPEELAWHIDVSTPFSFNLPRRLAEKMAKGTINDPLFRQFVPLKQERLCIAGFEADPVHDCDFVRGQKLLHKYEGRALIIATGACAMHCRFCFRQNYAYPQESRDFRQEMDIIKNDPSIEEVLLSGGDPLSLPDTTLKQLLDSLTVIAHVKRIRLHTRFPIGIPERIDTSFLELLANCPKQIWFVIHSNHVREFDNDVWQALRSIQERGIPILNQSVLLKDINDHPDILAELFLALADHGIIPYYLHQLDRVQGSAHFEVPVQQGLFLMSELQKRLPGYAVPKYVQEQPGQPSKTLLYSTLANF
jgi:lysine 2,3-aminomutase